MARDLIPPNYIQPMTIDDKLDALMQKVNKIEEDLFKLRNELSMTFGDEFNPKRAELSKELAGRMLTKLKGEFQAREMTAPSGNYWCDACQTAHSGDFVCLKCLNKGKKK